MLCQFHNLPNQWVCVNATEMIRGNDDRNGKYTSTDWVPRLYCQCNTLAVGRPCYVWSVDVYVLSVAGLVDAFVYHSSRAIQRKIQLGKTS